MAPKITVKAAVNWELEMSKRDEIIRSLSHKINGLTDIIHHQREIMGLLLELIR